MSIVNLNSKVLGNQLIERTFSRIEQSIELTFLSLRKQILFRNWCVVCLANLVAWFFEERYANPTVDSLAFRVAVCLMLAPLVLSNYISPLAGLVRFQKTYLLIYLILQLPFMFGLIGLLNAMHTPEGQLFSGIYFIEYMFAIFLCYGLISTEFQALIICAATHLVTLAIVVAIYPMQVERALLFSVGMVSGQLTMFTFAAFTHRRLQFVNQQKLEAAYAIGTKVAHEIRTPLLTIRNLVRAAELNLEEQNSAGVPSSNNEQIHDKLKKIANELTYANTTIDMLLVSSSAAPFNYDKAETTDIENCVHQAVEAYPYANTSEKSRITIQKGTNFRAIAPSRLIHHVLLNLIRNAILSAKSLGIPTINIGYQVNNNVGEVHVIDNGTGVPKAIEARIFENFFTTRTTGEGTGLGLAFCKSVMTEVGGDIEYTRRKGNSDFKLTFPISPDA